jgi:hypothetical protein
VVGEKGRAAVTAYAQQQSATALAGLGDVNAAERGMKQARESWSATRDDRYGDLDRPGALLALRRGQLDTAEALAAASVRRWEDFPLGHVQFGIVLATVHVRAGERDGLSMAHGVITAVGRLSSVRTRRQLQPLAAALQTRASRYLHRWTPVSTASQIPLTRTTRSSGRRRGAPPRVHPGAGVALRPRHERLL